MSGAVHANLSGHKELVAQLRGLTGPRMRSAARKSVAVAMRPTLAQAKAKTPVVSGRLRASLGQLSTSGRSAWSSSVGIRRNFRYSAKGRDAAGKRTRTRMVSGTGKARDRAIAKGAKQDRVAAQQYGRLIEFGTDKHGRMRRRAGGAHMLESTMQANIPTIISTMSAELRAQIQKA